MILPLAIAHALPLELPEPDPAWEAAAQLTGFEIGPCEAAPCARRVEGAVEIWLDEQTRLEQPVGRDRSRCSAWPLPDGAPRGGAERGTSNEMCFDVQFLGLAPRSYSLRPDPRSHRSRIW